MKSNILFVIFILSAAAMDSDNPIIPGMICLCAAVLLLLESRKENIHKRKNLRQQVQSVKKNTYLVLIIAQRKENAMVECRICHGNYDNGELIGGICPECIEEMQQEQERSHTVAMMLNSPSKQMKLEEFDNA